MSERVIVKFLDHPRLMSLSALASYFGISRSELSNMMPELRRRAFPNPMPMFGLYDRKLVDIWVDHIGGLGDSRAGFYPTEPQRLGSKFAPVRRTKARRLSARSKNTYTVAEAADEYLTWFRSHHKSARHITYRLNATILPHFGHRVVEDLTAPEIRAWHSAIAASPKAVHVGYGKPRRYLPPPRTDEEIRKRKNTANCHLMVLKALLNFAYLEGKVAGETPWRNVKPFGRVVLTDAEFLSVEECRRLMPLLNPDFRALARAALYTGARLSEITQIQAHDFNPDAGSVHIGPGKTARARHVILTEEGREFFASLVKNRLPDDLLFRRRDGALWHGSDAAHRLKIPCELAGFKKITFHSFRHTYASLLIMSGASIAAVAKNLGHRRTETCERYYAHLTQTHVSEEIRGHMPELRLGEQ